MKFSKIQIFFFLVVFSVNGAVAQVPSNFWFFGWGGGANPSGIDFTSGSPVQYNGVGKGGLYESITIQSDATKVLWYSNSHWVRDQNHDIMPGVLALPGSELDGAMGTAKGSAVQGAMSFPFPGSTTRYVLVSTAAVDGANHPLYYTDIDMSLPGNGTAGSPLGDLGTNIETDISGGVNTTEQVGVYAPSCNRIWVVTHEHGSNRFIAVEFTTAGPQAPVFSNAGNAYTGDGGRGSLRISPDGTKILVTGGSSGGLQIFSFNPASGVVSNPPATLNGGVTSLTPLPTGFDGWFFGYGAEWSPNSRYVYVGGYTGFSGIKVYDTQTSTVSALTGTGPYGDLQMGPDGVIYCAPQALGGGSLATITNPDLGPAASFSAAGHVIGASGGWLGLPNTFSCPSVVCPDTTIGGTIPAVCTGNGTIDLSAFENGKTGTWSITAGPAGYAATVVGTTFNVNSTAAGTYTVTFSIAGTGGACPANPTRSIVVNALPTATLTLGVDNACIDAGALNLTGGAAAGGVYSGTGVGVSPSFDPATAGAGVHTITYTLTDGNGCVGTATDDFTINSLPVIAFVLRDDEMCIDESPAGVSGGLPLGGIYSGTGISTSPIFDPAAAGVGAHVITYTVTDLNGCDASATDVMTVFGASSPTLVLDIDNACINSSALTLTGGSPIGGVYSGTGVGVSPSFDPSSAGLGNHIITYTYTDGNGCLGTATDDFTVNALPTPTLTLGVDNACIDAGALNLTGGAAAGGVYSGTGVGVSPSFDPALAGAGVHTITYTLTDGNGCSGTATDDFTVNALPTPTLTLGVDNACIDAGTLNLTGGAAAGGVYSGTGVGVSPSFDPALAGAGVHTITYSVTDVNGCVGSATDDFTVNVNSAPTLTLGVDNACIDAGVLNLAGGLPSGGVYSGMGVGVSPSFDPAAAGAGVHTITYTIADGNGCVGSATADFTVNNLPSPTLVLDTDAACLDAGVLNLTGGNPVGGVYSGPGIGVSPVFDPASAGAGVHVITYTYTDANGCAGVASPSDDFTVHTLPVVTFNLGVDVACANAPVFNLSGGLPIAVSPATGVYSGAGVGLSPGFDPSTAGSGTHSITYTYTDVNGCSSLAADDFTVNSTPVISFPALNEKCIDVPAFALISASPAGGVYSGTGVIGGVFDPAISLEGVFSVTYTYSDGNGCVSSAASDQIINPLPNVSLGPDVNVCDGTTELFTVSNFDQILWYDNSTGTSVTVDTTASVSVTVTDEKGCSSADTSEAKLVPRAVINKLREDTTICVKAGDQVLIEITNSGVTTEWQDGSAGSSFIAFSAGEYIGTITDGNGCMASDTVFLKDSCSAIKLTMPNIFTPNTNGVNDYFRPLELEWADIDFIVANIQYIRFQVYDRWGILMHTSEGVLPRWDGKSLKGRDCSDGTYFWKVEYMDGTDQNYNYNGFVKLYRPVK